MFRMLYVVSALLGLISPSLAVAAPEWEPVPGGKGLLECAYKNPATDVNGSDNEFAVGFEQDGPSVTVAFEAKADTKPFVVSVRFSIDGKATQQEAAIIATPGFGLLQIPVTDEIFKDLGKGKIVSVGSDQFSVVFPLEGSALAIAKAKACGSTLEPLHSAITARTTLSVARLRSTNQVTAAKALGDGTAEDLKCQSFGFPVGSATYGECRMTLYKEQILAEQYAKERKANQAMKMMQLGTSLLGASAAPSPTNTAPPITTYNIGGRVITCTTMQSYVNCQ
jgi:hypothetical protein